jgi:hypothetical protein
MAQALLAGTSELPLTYIWQKNEEASQPAENNLLV